MNNIVTELIWVTISMTSSKLVRNTILTWECPKVFEDFAVRKRVEKWQFSDEFGQISGWKVHLCLLCFRMRPKKANLRTPVLGEAAPRFGSLIGICMLFG